MRREVVEFEVLGDNGNEGGSARVNKPRVKIPHDYGSCKGKSGFQLRSMKTETRGEVENMRVAGKNQRLDRW